MSLHFGVDVDGVLAHHLPAMLEVVRDLTGLSLTPDQVTDYFFEGLVPRDQMEHVFNRCMDTAFELPPMPDIHLINQLPGKVSIVTHRDEAHAGVSTRLWLETHGIRYDDLIFTQGRKSLCGTFDYFVDDAPHNALDLAQAGVLTFLMEQPYNRLSDFGEWDEWVVRVGGWGEIRQVLDQKQLWGKKVS